MCVCVCVHALGTTLISYRLGWKDGGGGGGGDAAYPVKQCTFWKMTGRMSQKMASFVAIIARLAKRFLKRC